MSSIGRGRFWNRNTGVNECEIESVLPQDNPRMAPTKTALFSIEATAKDQSSSDSAERILLGIRSIDWASHLQRPKNLRWMHLSTEEIELGVFLTRALEAYGLYKHEEAGDVSDFIKRFSSEYERSSFQGKKLGTFALAMLGAQLPGHEKKTRLSFMAIPYFVLQNAVKRDSPLRPKAHWTQPLVQSAYHLDSSMAREHQQAIRRLHNHITQIIHVPKLWLLSIGDKFIATCSPTPPFDGQRSLIATRTIGRDPFPPTVRVTTNWGFAFCIERAQCSSWFKFLSRLQSKVRGLEDARMDTRDWVYRLEGDGSLIGAHRWRSLLQSHSDNELLSLLAFPGEAESSKRLTIPIPLEGKYSSDTSKTDTTAFWPRARVEILDPRTLEDYNLPYHWDSGERKLLIIAQPLTELDLKILYDHTRRLRAAEASDRPVRQNLAEIHDPYYRPPPYVLDAAKSQAETQKSQSHRSEQTTLHEETADWPAQMVAGKGRNPIFMWPIKDGSNVGLRFRDTLHGDHLLGDRALNKSPDPHHQVSSADEPTPTQWMKSLLAHAHRDILFTDDIRSARNYNNLPLKSKSDVDKHIIILRNRYHVNNHILSLISSFVHRVSDLLDCFIAEGYDCIVKGKAWAAVDIILLTFRSRSLDPPFLFQCDIFSIPWDVFIHQIQNLRDGLSGADNSYITHSMMRAFVQIMVLLADSAAEASRLMTDIKGARDRSQQDDQGGRKEQLLTLTSPPHLQDEFGKAKEVEEPSSPRSSTEGIDIQNSWEETNHTMLPNENQVVATAALSDQQNDFSRNLNRHIDLILSYFDRAQHECCAMFLSEEAQSSYNEIDCGRIITLILDSVLRGHSTCESIPILDMEEIYATYTNSLQLQGRNRPSKNLLLDINLLREELTIISDNISGQLYLIQADREGSPDENKGSETNKDKRTPVSFEELFGPTLDGKPVNNVSTQSALQQIQDRLQDAQDIFEELIKRVDRLEKQIVQRVDIIQEDHGKAILVFTIVSTIFLPLSFVTSYLGMNTADIRNMELSQALFWQVAAPFAAVVVSVVLIVAYNANDILAWLPRSPAFLS